MEGDRQDEISCPRPERATRNAGFSITGREHLQIPSILASRRWSQLVHHGPSPTRILSSPSFLLSLPVTDHQHPHTELDQNADLARQELEIGAALILSPLTHLGHPDRSSVSHCFCMSSKCLPQRKFRCSCVN